MKCHHTGKDGMMTHNWQLNDNKLAENIINRNISQSSSSSVSDNELAKSINIDFDQPTTSKTEEATPSREIINGEDEEEEEASTSYLVSPIIPRRLYMHGKQLSEDSIYSGTSTSTKNRYSLFSIDNSCFDLGSHTADHSAVGTPIEKIFPRDIFPTSSSAVTLENEETVIEETLDAILNAVEISNQATSSSSSDDDESSCITPLNHTPPTRKMTSVRVGSKLDSSFPFTKQPPSLIPIIPSLSLPRSDIANRLDQPVNIITESIPLRFVECLDELSPPPSPYSNREQGRLILPKFTRDQLQLQIEPSRPAPNLDLVVGGSGMVRSNENIPSTSTFQYRESIHKRQIGKRFGQLRVIEMLRVRILQLKGLRGGNTKAVYIVAKLDNKDIHFSSPIDRNSGDIILDEFITEDTGPFTILHLIVLEGSRTPGKTPRPLGRISLKRREIIRNSGTESCLPLRIVSKFKEVQGQICLEIRRNLNKFAVRVVDYSDLLLREPQELYLLISLHPDKESKKLRIHPGRFSEGWLEMDCNPEGPLSLKMSLWHDLLRGLNTVFHGQIRVDVDERWTTGPSKWFYLRPRHTDQTEDEQPDEKENKDSSLGEIRFWMSYTADHILPIDTYKSLMSALSSSASNQPFSASLVSVLENLPHVDLTVVARPLVQILAFSRHLRPLLSSLYAAEMHKCQEDLNTLFRSQSLATKMVYELLKLYGQHYLLLSLKPIVDKIYKERKCCEIDPSRLTSGESLDKNTANLLSYFSTTFSRIVESASRCPAPICTVLADLRTVVAEHTGRVDMERLALSSFLIMRFFAAAILSPKAFGIKREIPDSRVSRTLTLLSKMIQRVANCCVSEKPLSLKEPWLRDVLDRVTDDSHTNAMARFLDKVSLHNQIPSQSTESIAVLKDGYLIEARSQGRPSWRKVLHQKKRYVVLTDCDLLWQKNHRGEFNPKGSIPLCEIDSVSTEGKDILKIKGKKKEISFHTTGIIETNEWVSCIERQRIRAKRMSKGAELSELFESDVERQLEGIHMLLVRNADTLSMWKMMVETDTPAPESTPPLPKALLASHLQEDKRKIHREELVKTLENILSITYSIETAHREADTNYTNQMSLRSGTKELPIGDDKYLLLRRQLNIQQ